MPLLSKGIYGCETNSKKTPFGLLNRQIRIDGLLNNAGWFNSCGEKLGCGDLSIYDMYKISSEIPKDETFFVLAEFETTWCIPSHLDSGSPGVDYVMQNCLWLISRGTIYRIRTDASPEEITKDGVKYTRISRQELFKVINYNATAPIKNSFTLNYTELVKQAKVFARPILNTNLSLPGKKTSKTTPKMVLKKYTGKISP